MIKVENWCGHKIRFIEQNGEWWAILKDICDALELRTFKIAQRLDPDMMTRVKVEIKDDTPSRGLNFSEASDIPSRYITSEKDDVISNDLNFSNVSDHPSKGIRSINKKDNPISTGVRSRARKTQWMLAVNEIGIYEALFSSKRLEARKLRRWTATVLKKLRAHVGLEGYEVMRMTEKAVQDDIDHFLDTIFYDEETGQLMKSVTVPGGDVEQVPFEF